MGYVNELRLDDVCYGGLMVGVKLLSTTSHPDLHSSIPPANFLTPLSFSSSIMLSIAEQFHGLCAMDITAQLAHSP